MGRLSRDEILAMPVGRELDELVIKKIFKFTIVPSGTTFWNKKDAPFPFIMNDETWGMCLYEDDESEGWSYRTFNPSTDISAAWEVVEKMDKDGWDLRLIKSDDYREVAFGAYTVLNRDVPEAICKAALLTKLGADNP